jgi:hypothetical protein
VTRHSEPFRRWGADAGERIRLVASIAAAIYVMAWVVGLVLAPTGPGPTDAASKVHAYYVDHGRVVVAQSLLIHGLAGVCLLLLAWTLPLGLNPAGRASRDGGHPSPVRQTWWVRLNGCSAAVVSLVQVGLAVTAVLRADADNAATSHEWLWGINHLDTLKLVLVAAFVAGVTGMLRTAEEASLAARWLSRVGLGLSPLLLFGGSAFVFPSAVFAPLLDAALTLSLLILLVWAGLLAYVCRPRREADLNLHGA